MMRNPRTWFWLSVVIIVSSVTVFLFAPIQWGVDFTGGSLMEIKTTGVSVADVRGVLEEGVTYAVSIQTTGDNEILLRTKPLTEPEHQELLALLEEGGVLQEELRFESIGPTIGQELRSKAIISIGLVVLALILYLAYTFRSATELITSWKFGVAAVYALVHDLVFVAAIFILLAGFGATVDTMFVTAMLAILGYSVNDTIVIFNRLQKEWVSGPSGGLVAALDRALRGSLMRSLNTSLTTLLVLFALLLLGGATVRWFVAALTLGTLVGTYSSLFVAPPVLYILARKGAWRIRG